MSLDGVQTFQYIYKKASLDTIPRNHTDYQVLARWRILSGNAICVVVRTFCKYDSLEFFPDVIGSVQFFGVIYLIGMSVYLHLSSHTTPDIVPRITFTILKMVKILLGR